MLGQGERLRKPWEGRVALGQRIAEVTALNYPCLRLTFADGFTAEYDFGWLIQAGPAFEMLRDEAFFRTAHPGSCGASLEWSSHDGDEIDLGADTLRMHAEGIWDMKTRTWLR